MKISCCSRNNAPNLETNVVCCSAKVTIICILYGLIYTASLLAAVFSIKVQNGNFPNCQMILDAPLLLMLSPSGLLLILMIRQKWLMAICIIWPVSVVCTFVWIVHVEIVGGGKEYGPEIGKDEVLDALIIVCSVMASFFSIYCIILLICLIFSTSERNKNTDLFDLELGSVDGSDSSEQVHKHKNAQFVIR